MEKISVNPERLYTKSKYSEKFGISRPTIDKQIKDKILNVLIVKGAVLIIA